MSYSTPETRIVILKMPMIMSDSKMEILYLSNYHHVFQFSIKADVTVGLKTLFRR